MHRRRHWPSPRTKGLGTPNNPAIRFARGTVFGATLVHNCYGLSGCWPPCTDLTGLPANGGFYFQAFSGSVALPVAGYDYNSVWTSFCWRDFHPQEWQLASLHWSGRALQESSSSLGVRAVLHQCIRPTIGAWLLRAIMDISAHAISLPDRPRLGHLGHQCSHAPGRPILHLVSFSRRPRQVSRIDLATSSRAPSCSRIPVMSE